MVNAPKHKPVYSLDDVKEAAADERVSYFGRKVSRDIVNLGYSFEDVLDSIRALKPTDFVKSIAYGDGPLAELLCDVYDAQCSSADRDAADAIYLKLFIKDGVVYISSFHI